MSVTDTERQHHSDEGRRRCTRCLAWKPESEFLPRGRICFQCREPEAGNVCAYCDTPTGRGKAFCREHWLALDHWHRVQIGSAMRDGKESEEGPDENGMYQGEEYREVVRVAVGSLREKAKAKKGEVK